MRHAASPPRRPRRSSVLVLAIATGLIGASPSPAVALNPIKPVCHALGWVSGIAGKACSVVQHGDRLVNAGRRLLTGHVGGAAKALLGGGAPAPSTVVGLAAIGAWVLVGAKAALHETAKVIVRTTSPQLGTTWFSATYWRMTGLAAILTLPFLFAAAVQAVLRSDLALLARAALGYLPLAMLAVSIAAPVTMLLLAVSDEMAAIVSSAAGDGGARFLQQAGFTVGALSVLDGSPFLACLVGLLTAAAAVVLWVELLIRQAAVYVVVLMLPLAFAAFVWPARRQWAIRAVDLLVALILSKFAIVAVLALAGAALGHRGASGVGGTLTGMVLVSLGAFAPWALLRLVPLAELASGAAGSLRGEALRFRTSADIADMAAGQAAGWAGSLTAGIRRQADDTARASPDDGSSGARTELAKLAALPGAARSPALAMVGQPDAADEAGPGAEDGRLADGAPGDGAAASGEAVSGGEALFGGEGAGAFNRADGSSAERLPGLGAMWQAPDLSWRPLVLGLDEGWPPKSLWPNADGSSEHHGIPAEDRDPRPPKQESEEGPL